MTFQNLSSNDSDSDAYLKITLDVFYEHLRQAQQTFNLSIVAVTASLSISVIGAGLLVSRKAPDGSITTFTGLILTTLCAQIAKESNDKLEKLRADLKAIRPSSNT